MKRFLMAAAIALPLVVMAQPASAAITEVGSTTTVAQPACPGKPCLALTRTTGYQAKVGTTRGLMTIPQAGRIVAWTLALGRPGPTQTKFFQDGYGGTAQAQLTVLQLTKSLNYKVVAQSPIKQLTPYFGTVAQFPLVRSIPVHKGWVVAITVPTWAPVLSVGLGSDTSWRAARAKDKCDDNTTQTAQLTPNILTQYACLYRTARLTYSATLIPHPSSKRTATTTTPTTPTTPSTTTTTPTTTTPTTTTTK